MTNVCNETVAAPYFNWLSAWHLEWWGDAQALRDMERATGGPWWLVGGAAFVMFAAWTACYVVSLRQARRDASYGFPIVSVALNLGWELVFAFALIGPLPRFYFPLQWGHLLWAGIDSVNVAQIIRNGRATQSSPFTKRWFTPIVAGTFALAVPAPYFFMRYTGDIMGVSSAMIIDVVMAALFINLFANRPTSKGLSLWGGVFRLIGDVASFVFLYLWWPAQFAADGTFAACDAPAYAGIVRPASFVFLYGMYVAATALDGLYIALLLARRNSVAHGSTPGR